jgi:hypothetical protein
MTDTERSDAKILLKRQFYFVKEHLRTLPPYFFILQLDTPLSKDNPMTLRRAMMSQQVPSKSATSQVISDVDASWNQPSKHIITTVVGRDVKAQRFLANMIPKLLHRFRDEASKWFTGLGLLVYKDVNWDPKKGTTSSAKERDSEEMVEEDLWDLTSKWEQLNVNKASTCPDKAALDDRPAAMPVNGTTAKAPTSGFTEKTEHLASDKSIASFRHACSQPINEDDIKEADDLAKAAQADKPVDLTGTQFEFSTEQLERDRQKAQDGPLSTGMSMSTAAKTTPRTRLKLKEAQDKIAELRLALTQHAVLNPPAVSLQSTESPPKLRPQPPGKDSNKRQVDAFTENQALGAAISKPSHDANQVESGAMEEDHHKPIVIGSSSSDSAS